MGGNCLGGNYSGVIVRRVKSPGGNCPGGISLGAVVQVVVVQGDLFRGYCVGYLSWVEFHGSNCLGGGCPDTDFPCEYR